MWTFIKTLLGPIWSWVAGIAVIGAVIGGIYAKGNYDGRQTIKAQWDAAIAADIKRGAADNAAAERAVPLNPTPDELCKSKWNRTPC